jgi:hypothetical protein
MNSPFSLIPLNSSHISSGHNLGQPTVPFDRSLNPTSPQAGDAEAKMRRSLGLDTTSNRVSAPSIPADPMRGARQAIRSQAAAREYVERQLAHAEATIQDLRTKLHHARQDKDAAVEAARSATAREVNAERNLISIDSVLTTEKASRELGDRALREAQATMRDQQGRLDVAVQGLEKAKAELAAERQARQTAKDALREATATRRTTERLAKASIAEAIEQPSTAAVSPNGSSPRAIEVAPVTRPDRPKDFSTAAPPTDRDEIGLATVRRLVGRSRKSASVQPVQISDKPTGKAPTFTKIIIGKTSSRRKASSPAVDEQKPVEWWIEGWDRRDK